MGNLPLQARNLHCGEQEHGPDSAGAALLLLKLLDKCTVGGLALHAWNTCVISPAQMSQILQYHQSQAAVDASRMPRCLQKNCACSKVDVNCQAVRRKYLTWHSEQQALSLSTCRLHLLWSKLFLDKHSWIRQASVLQGSLSVFCDHPNIFIGPHESGVPVSFPMLSVKAGTRSESAASGTFLWTVNEKVYQVILFGTCLLCASLQHDIGLRSCCLFTRMPKAQPYTGEACQSSRRHQQLHAHRNVDSGFAEKWNATLPGECTKSSRYNPAMHTLAAAKSITICAALIISVYVSRRATTGIGGAPAGPSVERMTSLRKSHGSMGSQSGYPSVSQMAVRTAFEAICELVGR